MHKRFSLSLLALCFLLLSCACLAQPPAAEQVLCGARLHLVVPAGWQFMPAGGAGAVLQSEQKPETPPIEIVGWDVPRGGDRSPAAAASAQETLLVRTGPYARTSASEYKTPAGVTGLLVIGQVKSVDGKLQDAVFAAFAEEGRFYVVGTFAATGTGADAVKGPFGEVLQSLRFTEAPPTSPSPAHKPVEPPPAMTPEPKEPPVAVTPPASPVQPVVPDTPPTLPAPPTQPVVPDTAPTTPAPPVANPVVKQPATPPPAPAPVVVAPPLPPAPQPEPTVAYESPLGFQLQYPKGWTVKADEGRIEVAPPAEGGTDTPGALAVIWPVAAITAEQDPVALARALLGTWKLTSPGAASLTARAAADGTAILSGTISVQGAPRRLICCCEVRGTGALLTIFFARPEEFAKDLPLLTGVLGSFTGGPWWTREAGSERDMTVWHDPNGAGLQVPIPAGWKVRGGTQNYNGTWSIFVDLASNDARHLSVTWQQPVVPLYRELTPVLRNLGWQEGDKYVANSGDQALRILSRLSPQDFLIRHWLANSPFRLSDAVIDHVDALSQPPALLIGTNLTAVSASMHGTSDSGPRRRYCLIATADAPARIGTSCWQASVLQVDAPPGDLDEALAVMRTAITGAEVTGTQSGVTALLQSLRGAQEALAALPPAATSAPAAREVLTNLGPRGKGDLWVLSPTALTPWQEAARSLQSDPKTDDGLIPELKETFWK